MTDTPPPRRAGNRKTLGFLVGAFVLIAAVAVAYFADGERAGSGLTPPAATGASAPVANPAEPPAAGGSSAPAAVQ